MAKNMQGRVAHAIEFALKKDHDERGGVSHAPSQQVLVLITLTQTVAALCDRLEAIHDALDSWHG